MNMDFGVDGMTCHKCVDALTAEVRDVPGVDGVEIDLNAGAMRVFSNAPVDRALVNAAIAVAGFTVR